MNQALMQADLAKLPLWSGDATKDVYTVEQWCKRVDKAAVSAGWDAGNTMSYVYNALRGEALRWYESLKRFNINDNDWPAVRAEMLDAYSRVQTARTAVVNLSDLKQGASESVTNFGSRVARIVDNLEILMPAASRVPAGVPWDAAITALARWGGVAADVKAKQLQDAANRVIWNTYNHLGVQLFISNLKPVFRDEMLKAPPTDLKYDSWRKSCSNQKIRCPLSQQFNKRPQEVTTKWMPKSQHCQPNFKICLKSAMAPTAGEEEGLQTVIAEDGEAEDAVRPEEVEPPTAPAPTTCAGIAKSQAISKKSATPESKPEPHRWTPYTYAQEMEEEDQGAEAAAAGGVTNPWAPQNYEWESMQEVDFC